MTPPGRHRHLFSVTTRHPQGPSSGPAATYTVIGTTDLDGLPIAAATIRQRTSMARTQHRIPVINGAAWLVHVEARSRREARDLAEAAAYLR